jgi:hypothetical protein
MSNGREVGSLQPVAVADHQTANDGITHREFEPWILLFTDY